MRQAEKHAIVAEKVLDGTAVADNAAVIYGQLQQH